MYARLLPFLPPPGAEPGPADAGPAGAPDPTRVFRQPFAPRARARAPAADGQAPTAVLPGPEAQPAPVPAGLREVIKDAYARSDALPAGERLVVDDVSR